MPPTVAELLARAAALAGAHPPQVFAARQVVLIASRCAVRCSSKHCCRPLCPPSPLPESQCTRQVSSRRSDANTPDITYVIQGLKEIAMVQQQL